MTCPHLEYRREANDRAFEVERAYCTVAGGFVQPMRADICNDRYDLHHAEHCEIYRDYEGTAGGSDAGGTAGGSSDDAGGRGANGSAETNR